jgi:hypothetical protein
MKNSLSKVWLAFCATVLAALAPGVAAPQNPPEVVAVKTVLAADGVHPGKTLKVAAVAHITPGYHINDHKPTLDYLIPTEWKLDSPSPLSVETVVYPKGELKKFAFSDRQLSVYEGDLTVGALLRVARDATPGVYTLKGKFSYQACLPPRTLPVTLTVNVVGRRTPLKTLNQDIFSRLGELEPARKNL